MQNGARKHIKEIIMIDILLQIVSVIAPLGCAIVYAIDRDFNTALAWTVAFIYAVMYYGTENGFIH